MKKLLRITFILICAVRRLHRRGCWGRQRSVVYLLLSAVVIAVSALNASPIPLSTTTEFTSTAIARFRAYHGETVRLTHRLTLAGAPLDLSGASARFYWRTEEMEDWWSTDATLEGDAVSCDFTPAMDPGTEAIWYFFGITQENAIAYRANGSLTLLDSPGFIPADLGEPDALAAALEALFKEADSRYATRAQLAANSEQLTDLKDALNAKQDKLTVDSTLSASSTNPIQNQAVKAALDKKAEKSHTHAISQVNNLQAYLSQLDYKASKSTFNSDDINLPYVKAYGASMHSLRTVFNANNEADNWAEKFDNAKLTFEWWHQYDNVKEDSFDVPIKTFRELANGGGGHTEVWKANVGFGAQDTFFGPKKVADGDGQFLNGYPRLHNHGQDIHEVSGFSRDSRDDETVWSHRLLLPWDLAKANDTSYLMAGVVWESTRLGVNTRFVQPLLPTNTPEATSALGLPYALPCFENSPIFWNGHLIFSDDGASVKQVQIPWGRISNGETAKVPIIHGDKSQLSIEDDEGRTLVIYEDGRGGYVHTKGMTTSPTGFSFVTQALLDRISALESLTPTLEVATWSGSVCSVPWGANPLLIDCTDLEVADVVFSFPIDSWPEGAQRTLILRTGAMTDATGTGTLLHAFTQQDTTLLTAKIHGYEVFPTGEEIICSAMRLGTTLHLTTTMRSSL